MAEILAFPRRPVRGDREKPADDGAARRLVSALDGFGKTMADLLLALLSELEDASLRLSLAIERTAGELEKRSLGAEQQELRATIAELRRAIGNEAQNGHRV